MESSDNTIVSIFPPRTNAEGKFESDDKDELVNEDSNSVESGDDDPSSSDREEGREQWDDGLSDDEADAAPSQQPQEDDAIDISALESRQGFGGVNPTSCGYDVDVAVEHMAQALVDANTTSSAVPWISRIGMSAGSTGGVCSATICTQAALSAGLAEK